jgi:hypothetical protein
MLALSLVYVSSSAGGFGPTVAFLSRRRRALMLSRLQRRPVTRMFEDSANDCGVIDQRDCVHRRATLTSSNDDTPLRRGSPFLGPGQMTASGRTQPIGIWALRQRSSLE